MARRRPTTEQVDEAIERDRAIARRNAIAALYGHEQSGAKLTIDEWQGNDDDGLEDLHEDYPGQHITGPDTVE